MNKLLNDRILQLPKQLIYRLKLINVVCLSIAFSNLSYAQIVTHPLNDAPSAQPPETKNSAQPESADINQSNQVEKYFNEEFGGKKKLGSCSMTYKLEGASLAYRQYDGTGEITCRNGQKAKVSLSSKSIGFSIGYSVIEGEAYFSDVKYINEILGNYISLGNHFGFINSIDRQVLTRGEISLVLIGKGKGFDIGVTIGDLSIKPR